MTIKDKIKAVLTDTKANFQAGAALYNQLGDNPNLKDVFQRRAKRNKQDARTIGKLKYCLKQILKSLPTEPQQLPKTEFAPTIILHQKTDASAKNPTIVKWIPFDAPSPLQKLKEKYILLAREEIQLHGRLFPEVGLSTDKCYEICVKIMDIKKEQDKIGDAVRLWKNTGELPVVTTSGFKEGFEAHKRLKTLVTRPKRLRQQIENAKNDEEKAKYQKKLEEVEAEIAYIEKQVNAN